MRLFILLMLISSFVIAKSNCEVKKDNGIVLNNKNVIILRGVVYGEAVSKIMQKTIELDNKLDDEEPLYLFIDSPGGSIVAGYELIQFLEGLGREVHTIVNFAASMGFIIHESLGKRYIFPYSMLMAHNAYGVFYGEFGNFNSQLSNRISVWIRRIDRINSEIAIRVGLDVDKWKKMHENEYWVNGFNAVKKGMSDTIVKVKCSKTLSGSYFENFKIWGFDISIEWAECPLITSPLEINISSPYMSNDHPNKVHQEEMKKLLYSKLKQFYNYKSWSPLKIKKVNTIDNNISNLFKKD